MVAIYFYQHVSPVSVVFSQPEGTLTVTTVSRLSCINRHAKKFQNDVSDKLVEKTQQKKNEKSLVQLHVYKVLILFVSAIIVSPVCSFSLLLFQYRLKYSF